MKKEWCDLPLDLLSKIADSLELISLLSFRGVCKDWYSASSNASAHIELTNEPWFLMYGDKGSECTLLSYYGRTFTLTIPEMDNSTCLASNAGWLLLFRKKSLFFFCPISRSKIDLPSSPFPHLSGHHAAFSSPPTSPDCIVAVVKSVTSFELQLFLLRKGSTKWTEHKYRAETVFNRLTGALFQEGTFHVLDHSCGLVTYSDERNEWKRFVLVPPSTSSSNNMLSYATHSSRFQRLDVKCKLRLENNVTIFICSAIVPHTAFGFDCDTLIKGETIQAIEESESRCLRGIWIQPRYFQVSPDHKWVA